MWRTAAARASARLLGGGSHRRIGKLGIAAAWRDDPCACSHLCGDGSQLEHLAGDCRRRVWSHHWRQHRLLARLKVWLRASTAIRRAYRYARASHQARAVPVLAARSEGCLPWPLCCVAADIGGIPRWAQSHGNARIPDGQCDWRAHLGYGVRCRRLHLWQSAAATSSRPRAHRTRTRLGRLFWVWLLDPPLRRPAYRSGRTCLARAARGCASCEKAIVCPASINGEMRLGIALYALLRRDACDLVRSNPLPLRSALEIFLHRLEVAALPSAVSVAGGAVGHIAVMHGDPGAFRRRLKEHLDLRIGIGRGEFCGAPRLNDAAGPLELKIAPADVAVPHRERSVLLRRNLCRFPAGHFFVPVAAEPRVVDRLRACRNDVGYGKLEWHDAVPVC